MVLRCDGRITLNLDVAGGTTMPFREGRKWWYSNGWMKVMAPRR
jgi:hypothetical protein